jgi:hypothetical protein
MKNFVAFMSTAMLIKGDKFTKVVDCNFQAVLKFSFITGFFFGPATFANSGESFRK